MKKYFFMSIIIIISLFSCSKKVTDPVEPLHRWYPTELARGGDNLHFQIIFGNFPIDLPSLQFDIPYNGNITSMISKIIKDSLPVSGVHVLIRDSGGDSVYLKEFSLLDHLYFPTMASPAYPPEYNYPLVPGNTYSINIQTDSGSANGTVIMPYINLTFPGENDTVFDLDSIGDYLWLTWNTTPTGGNQVSVATAIFELTGDYAIGPIPIPFPDTLSTFPIPTSILSEGNVTIYFSGVNMDTINGSIFKYDTFTTVIGDTLFGNYCFPSAFYTMKRQIRFKTTKSQ